MEQTKQTSLPWRKEKGTSSFHKYGLTIKESKSPWQNGLKGSQKREDKLLQQTVTRTDNGTKSELLNCFNAWVHICDEDEIMKKDSLQEEELKQCFERNSLP